MRAIVRLVLLLATLAFAAAAFDPVAIAFGERLAATSTVELSEPAPANAALRAAAVAGPRASDLALIARGAVRPLPGGPLGAQVATAIEPLPFLPEAFELRALRPPTVGRPAALTLRFLAAAAELPLVDVVVRDGDRELLRQRVRCAAAGEPVEVSFVSEREGAVAVELAVDVGAQRLVRAGSVEVGPAPRALVLEPSGVVAAALSAQGVVVDRASAMTTDLSRYAVAVVGAPLIVPLQQALVEAVDAGLGLLVLAPAFGNPGEPLHDLLPVVPEPVTDATTAGAGTGAPAPPSPTVTPPPTAERPPSGEIRDPSPVSNEPVEVDKHTIAMVLVVDRSGSMGALTKAGRSKMSYAKTSALQSAQALAVGDEVGVVTFGNKGAGRVELPLTDAQELAKVRGGVERLAHGPEYTYLLSGLQQAEQLLRPARTAVKHVVVITDGEFDTSETIALRALAYRMFREAKISISILSIVDGQMPSGFKSDAEEITRDGGGEFFAIDAAESVPVFVSAEVRRSLQRAGRQPGGEPRADSAPEAQEPQPLPPVDPEPAREEPPPPPPARVPVRAVATSPVLEPLPLDWPTLGSAVATTAPLDAQVLLVAGDQGWPLLAYGNRGLGRIGAFAADLGGEAGAEFRQEPAFPARLTLWVQHVMRAEPVGEPQLLAMTTSIEPGAPTPADVEALQRLGGSPIQREIAPAPAMVTRAVGSLVPQWALWALGLLVLLALVERIAVLRGRA